LGATDQRNTGNITSIAIGIDSVEVQQGMTYTLQTLRAGHAGAEYNHSYLNSTNTAYLGYQFGTTDTITGQLYITRFDLLGQIASGTFWFNLLDQNNDTMRITDGRFDVKLNQP
jgi:hypothetical protein